MSNESKSPPQVAGSSPGTPRAGKLVRAGKLREEAKQLKARAAGLERRHIIERQKARSRDYRILGSVMVTLALDSPTLARAIMDGVRRGGISNRDRQHLAREGSALMWMQDVVQGKRAVIDPIGPGPA